MRVSHRLIVVVVALIASSATAYFQAQSVPELAGATSAFLEALTPAQKSKIQFDFDSGERFNWNYVPLARKGLPMKEIQESQRPLMYRMLVAALGTRGRIKTLTVMDLENLLRRDPELYYFSVFGQPSQTGMWGWRLEGHHVAFNITMDKGKFASSTPAFLGANPAEVKEGLQKGFRALAPEEDMARRFLWSMDPAQRKTAIVDVKSPSDIITGNLRQAQALTPVGLPAARLNPRQKEMLFELIKEYAERNAGESSLATMTELTHLALDKLYFAWAGSEDPGMPHYYRIQSPTFLIEYDNTQDNANHIHSVWRDLKNDFGVDVLREHYKTAHLQ